MKLAAGCMPNRPGSLQRLRRGCRRAAATAPYGAGAERRRRRGPASGRAVRTDARVARAHGQCAWHRLGRGTGLPGSAAWCPAEPVPASLPGRCRDDTCQKKGHAVISKDVVKSWAAVSCCPAMWFCWPTADTALPCWSLRR